MRSIATHVAWSVCMSVRLLVTNASPTKPTEPIEVPFGAYTRVGPRNRVFGGARIPMKRDTLRHVHAQTCPRLICSTLLARDMQMRCRSGYRQLVATRSLSNHSRHLSVTPALLRSRLISVFFRDYTRWSKKWGHRLMTIVLSNLNRLNSLEDYLVNF